MHDMTLAESLEQIDTERSLPELMRLLAEARRDQVTAYVRATKATKAMEASPLWASYMSACGEASDARVQVAVLEEAIRKAAVSQFENGGSKRPAQGLEVRMYTKLLYNAATAEAWVRAQAPVLLRFDAKSFEKHAPDMPGSPITLLSEPRCQIANDLSAYLED